MIPNPEMITPWEKLVDARRRSVAAGAPALDESAPFGFAQRVVAQAMELRRNERLGWWTRWSMRAACSAGLAAALLALFSPSGEFRAPLLAVPPLEIPTFSSP